MISLQNEILYLKKLNDFAFIDMKLKIALEMWNNFFKQWKFDLKKDKLIYERWLYGDHE